MPTSYPNLNIFSNYSPVNPFILSNFQNTNYHTWSPQSNSTNSNCSSLNGNFFLTNYQSSLSSEHQRSLRFQNQPSDISQEHRYGQIRDFSSPLMASSSLNPGYSWISQSPSSSNLPSYSSTTSDPIFGSQVPSIWNPPSLSFANTIPEQDPSHPFYNNLLSKTEAGSFQMSYVLPLS